MSALSSSTRRSDAVSSSSSTMHGNTDKRRGCLEVTLLQLTDVPFSDQVPLGVQFSIVPGLADNDKKKQPTTKVWSGPPTQRLKNGCSFRFAPGVLELVEPLQSLYHSKLKVEVVYKNNSNENGASNAMQTITLLQGELQLRQLCIHRHKDLALKLKPTKAANALVTTDNNDFDKESPPTIRLRLQLSGPLRPVVQTALHYFNLYIGLIDQAQDQLWEPVFEQAIQPILPMLPVGLGLGAVPVVTTTLVVSPLVIGISLLFFPLLAEQCIDIIPSKGNQ